MSVPLAVAAPETRSMTTPDGVRLDADIWRPAGGGPYPVLLQRQAYGRRIACGICYAHPSWYAAQGYIVVVQDVRGRGTSEGIFRPGENEIADGAAAVTWAAALEGSTGTVGMYGFSYQAVNQLLAACGDSPALKALAPAMGPWDIGRSWTYENGALRLKQMIGWGIQVTAEAARRAGDIAAYTELAAAGQALPLHGPIAARPDVLVRHRHLSHAMDWIEQAEESPYWATISPSAHRDLLRARDLPVLSVGGWFDTHLGGTLDVHAALSGAGDRKRHLVVGPWLHFPWARKVGALDFGPDAAADMDRLHVRWFDHWLKGIANGVAEEKPVRLFDMGANVWRAMDAVAAPRRVFFLAATGRASIDVLDGRLADAPPPHAGMDYLVHDPWRPAPVTGGCYGTPPGPVDRAATDARGDVLTFTTAPLDAPLTLAGEVAASLVATADQKSFDLSCVLSRVTPGGQVFQLATGHRHCPPGAAAPMEIPLLATCATLHPGERLRLSVAGACFPAYPVNPGTGGDPAATPAAEALITTIGIAHGPSGSTLSCAVLATTA